MADGVVEPAAPRFDAIEGVVWIKGAGREFGPFNDMAEARAWFLRHHRAWQTGAPLPPP